MGTLSFPQMEHPWITFSVDLKQMPASFWMLLGEARSKCDHLCHALLPKAYADELHRINLAKGAHATTAIEGNSLSEDAVRAIVEHAPDLGHSGYQVREVENVIAAYNGVLSELRAGRRPQLSPKLISDFNRQVLDGLTGLEPHVRPGEIRAESVVVGSYRAPDFGEVAGLLHQTCMWLNGPSFGAEGSMKIPTAIIRASLAHLYLAWIHPFGDGNGRTARLCEYLVLVTSGVPTSAAHLISNYCNETRDEYYRQLRFASESGGNVTQFLSYCAQGFVAGLGEQLDFVYGRQLRLTWREHVTTEVTGRDPKVRDRRASIADALGGRGSVHKRQIPMLTPELARSYATCGPKTLTRDLNTLVADGLLIEEGGYYLANDQVLRGLLPLVVNEDS